MALALVEVVFEDIPHGVVNIGDACFFCRMGNGMKEGQKSSMSHGEMIENGQVTGDMMGMSK